MILIICWKHKMVNATHRDGVYDTEAFTLMYKKNVITESLKRINCKGLKAFTIDGQHRLVMNADASFLFKPLVKNNRAGCAIEPASGEISAQVDHDGVSFVVGTAHCKAVIAGITFDIKATDTAAIL